MCAKKFSIQDFKNWLSQQEDASRFFNLGIEQQSKDDEYVGRHARPRVSEGKLLEKIQCDDDPQSVVQDFIENGGEVISVEGKNFQIESTSGSFLLPRFCVKLKKKE